MMIHTTIGRQLLAAILTAACSAAISAAAVADDPSSKLEGAWKILSVESEGEARQLDDDVRWLIKGDKVFYGGEPLATVINYRASTPKGIDLSFHEPQKEYEGIYAIENDVLRVCLNTRTSGPKERPSDFATKDKPNSRVLAFQRLAPADALPEVGKGFVGMALAVENEAIVINMVLENSPAEKAGLRAGDVLLRIGDQRVADLQGTVD